MHNTLSRKKGSIPQAVEMGHEKAQRFVKLSTMEQQEAVLKG